MAAPQTRCYLDYNATSPVLPQVVAAMSDVMGHPGNPSSVHRDGRKLRSRIDDARERIGALVGGGRSTVTFTSGGTEANATAIIGSVKAGMVSRVLCSAIEHPSVLEHASEEQKVSVSKDGIVDLESLEKQLATGDGPALVCVMFANNETGVLQPIEAVCQIAHKHGSYVLCDAVQAPGRETIEGRALGVDLLSLSAHKFGGPQGVGALINFSGLDLKPILVGGGQEKQRRSGTENSPGIIGFGEAVKSVLESSPRDDLEILRNRLEQSLSEARPESTIIGRDVGRLSNTTCVSLPGVPSENQVINLDLAGSSISSGSACSSGKMAKSHVLIAMALDADIVASSIRISIGQATHWDDLARFVQCWSSL